MRTMNKEIEEMRKKIIKTYPPEDMPRYYKRIREYFEMKMPHSALAGKADLGSCRSEKGYQIIAASACGRMARALGASEDKAEALSLAVGQFFPKYGMAGLEPIKEYITKNNLALDLDTLGVELVECMICVRLFVAAELDEKLRQYFGGDDSDLEVRIVRFVQQTIKDVKIAEKYFNGDPGDLLFNVIEEIGKLAKENGKITPSRILEQYRAQIDAYQAPVLTEEQRQEVITELDGYVHGLRDKTPETAVLIYMYVSD